MDTLNHEHSALTSTGKCVGILTSEGEMNCRLRWRTTCHTPTLWMHWKWWT